MAIANRTTTTANTGSAAAASLTVNKPTGTSAGDLLITVLSVNNGSSCTITTLSGWTLLKRNNNTTVLGQGIYYRVADGSEGSSFTWSFTSEFASIVCNAYTGVDSNNPIAGISVLGKTTASTSATFSNATPQAESAYPVACVTSRNTTAAQTITTASSGYVTNGDTATTATTFIQAAIMDQHAAGTLPIAAIGAGNATFSTTSTDFDSIVLLRPIVTTATGGFSIDLATIASEITDAAGGVTTNAFSTGYANEVLVAVIAGDAGLTSNMTVSGGGLTWTRQISQITAHGSSYLYTAVAASPLSNVTVTFSDTGDTTTSVGVALYGLLGVNTSTPIGASTQQNTGAAGAMNLTVTTTANNSWVWANYNDYTANTASTASGGSQTVSSIANSGDGNRYAVLRKTAVTATSGTGAAMTTSAPTADSILAFGFEILAAVSAVPTNLFFF